MARHKRRRHFSFEPLEPRILLSADALGGAVGDNLFDDPEAPFQLVPDQQLNLETMATSLSAQYGTTETAPAAMDLEGLGAFLDTDSQADIRHEIIFVDTGVDGYEELLQDLMTDTGSTEYSVFLLDSSIDGIGQISSILQDMENLDAIHLLSHGDEGRVQLGASWLDNASLADNRDAIADWGSALSEGADILIYGCKLAGNADGLALLDSLVELTGADNVRLVGNLLGDPEQEIPIGRQVRGVFEHHQDEPAFTLLQWELSNR